MKLINRNIKINNRNFNLGKKEIIVVQGLGFVGSVMSLICANSKKNRMIFGIDLDNKISQQKINQLNRGKFPFKTADKKIQKELDKAIKKKNFYATTDKNVYKIADVIVVDINLDVLKKRNKRNNALNSYKVQINPFLKGIDTISKHCKENALIVIETTVPPGTTENLVKPLVLKNLKKRNLNLNKIMIGHSYERVMPGKQYVDSIRNYYRVFSGINNKSEDSTRNFLNSIINTKKYPLTKLRNTNESEIAKVLENSYRAMNISFMIEWSRFSEIAKANLYSIANAIKKRDTHNNIMLPGIGVGGYCLPKDSLLADWSSKKIFKSKKILKFSTEAICQNDMMPYYAYKFIQLKTNFSLKNKKILFLGCSYTKNVGDTRSSPVFQLLKNIQKNTKKLYVHDPYISYWHEAKIKTIKFSKIKQIKPNIIIYSTMHDEYKNNKFLINTFKKLKKNIKIFDLVGALNEKEQKILGNDKLEILGVGNFG